MISSAGHWGTARRESHDRGPLPTSSVCSWTSVHGACNLNTHRHLPGICENRDSDSFGLRWGLGVCISDSCCGSADHAWGTESIETPGSTAGRVTVTPLVRKIRLQQSSGVLTSSVHSYYVGTFTNPGAQASEQVNQPGYLYWGRDCTFQSSHVVLLYRWVGRLLPYCSAVCLEASQAPP